MMKTYERLEGQFHDAAPSLICSTTDFTQTTTQPDGATLMVVDESSHTVTGYYVAYNGFWNVM